MKIKVVIDNIMKKFKKEIINIHKQYGIASSYDSSEELIYSNLHNEYGDVFCIFSYERNLISSNSIYARNIPVNIISHLQSILDNMNKNFEKGRLYIDRNTNCVAFSVDYEVSDLKLQEKDQDLFRSFCIQFYDVFATYQKDIYEIISLNHDSIRSAGSC